MANPCILFVCPANQQRPRRGGLLRYGSRSNEGSCSFIRRLHFLPAFLCPCTFPVGTRGMIFRALSFFFSRCWCVASLVSTLRASGVLVSQCLLCRWCKCGVL